MDRYRETSETWNKLATLYQEKFMDLDLYDESYDHICNSIEKERAKLLEIGCGPGNISKYLLSKRPGFEIFGIDIAPNMIELAKANNPSASFAVMDCRDICNLASGFDAIVCGFCLPFLAQEDGMKLIQDCAHLLNDEGLIYLSFVEGSPDQSDYKVGSTGDRVYFNLYHLHDLQHELIRYNFEEIKVFKVPFSTATGGEIHTIITAKKKITSNPERV